jgi:hypothetical protein
MNQSTEALLQHFFSKELKQKRLYRTGAWCCMIGMILLSLASYLNEIGVVLSTAINLMGLALVFVLFSRFQTLDRSLDERLSAFLTQIEVDWSAISTLDLSNEHQEAIYHAYTTTFSPIGKINEAQRRIRGRDEKGPAFGDASERFAREAVPQDPNEHEADFKNLEGPLRPAETLVEEANQAYTEHAQARWKQAENNDMDLIETGANSLAELLASGWFEKNAEVGAVSSLMESGQER